MIFNVNFSLAQQREHQGPPPIPNDNQIKEMIEELSKELSLTTEQTKNISALYFKHFKKMKEKQEINKGNKKPNHKEHEKFRTEFHNEVKTFLTEVQKKQFDEFVKKQHRKQGSKKGPKTGKGLDK